MIYLIFDYLEINNAVVSHNPYGLNPISAAHVQLNITRFLTLSTTRPLQSALKFCPVLLVDSSRFLRRILDPVRTSDANIWSCPNVLYRYVGNRPNVQIQLNNNEKKTVYNIDKKKKKWINLPGLENILRSKAMPSTHHWPKRTLFGNVRFIVRWGRTRHYTRYYLDTWNNFKSVLLTLSPIRIVSFIVLCIGPESRR